MTLASNNKTDTIEITSFRGIDGNDSNHNIVGGGGIELYKESAYYYEGYVQGYEVGAVLNEVEYLRDFATTDHYIRLISHTIDAESLIRFHLQLAD